MENLCLKNNLLVIIYLSCILIIGTNLYAYSVGSSEVIALSEKIRENELELEHFNDYKELLNLKKTRNLETLNYYKQEISNSIVALYKLTYLPLQFLLTNNRSQQDLVISYSLFNYYIRYIRLESAKAQEYISIINRDEQELARLKNKIVNITNELKHNSELLNTQLKSTYSKNTPLITSLKKRNAQLIKESDTIYKLVTKLNNSGLLKEEITLDIQMKKAKGKFVWPNYGYLDKKYKESSNQLYKYGMIILAPANSQIVAPYDGEVVFVDEFEPFNTLIIIKHSPSYYSIISGKYSVFVRQMQLVKTHEPIAMSSNKMSAIYFEMKNKEESIDPQAWLQKRK